MGREKEPWRGFCVGLECSLEERGDSESGMVGSEGELFVSDEVSTLEMGRTCCCL
jgi:hypothetical protein